MPCQAASPFGESKGREDSLTQQLKALQEAKSAAAAMKASSDPDGGCKKDSLGRENIPPLQIPSNRGLAEALKKWQIPQGKEDAGRNCQTAPSSVPTIMTQQDADHEAYAGMIDVTAPPSPLSTEAELHEACRGVLNAVHAAEERAINQDGTSYIISPAVASAQDPACKTSHSGDIGTGCVRSSGLSSRTEATITEHAATYPDMKVGQQLDEGRHDNLVPSRTDRARQVAQEGPLSMRQGSPSRRQASPRPASPRPASPKPALARHVPSPRPTQQRPASPPRNPSPGTRARESRRTARPSAAPDSARGPSSRRAPCPDAAEAPLLSDEEIQAELEQCRHSIASCAQDITPQNLRELRSLRKPPGAVSSILEATAVLLGALEAQQDRRALQGAPPEKKEIELDFREVRKTLQGNLPDRIREINPEKVTLAQFRRLRKLLALPGFDEERVRGICPSAVPLTALSRAVGACLSKTRQWTGSEAATQCPTDAAGRAPASARGTGGEAQEATGNRSPSKQSASGPMTVVPKRNANIVIKPDLSSLTKKELQQVSELMVCCPDVGSIVFHGITDCSDLDLPTLVHLDVGEVLVYPGGSKPPPGQGLNKHATVTLYQCWPPNGLGNLEDDVSRQRYRKRIQVMTEDKGARFIDYDCLSGVWKFQVEHF